MKNFTDAQMRTMLQLQDQLNRKINPDWIAADYPWHRAAWVEAAELADSLSWKWWKQQTPDLENARIEVIDLWHFALSFLLQCARGDVDDAIKLYTRECELIQQGKTPLAQRGVLELIDLFAGISGTGHVVSPGLICAIADKLGIGHAQIHTTYLGKNILNIFRQDHGYQSGDYIKDWGTGEDNAYLTEIMRRRPDAPPVLLLALLEEKYATVKAQH